MGNGPRLRTIDEAYKTAQFRAMFLMRVGRLLRDVTAASPDTCVYVGTLFGARPDNVSTLTREVNAQLPGVIAELTRQRRPMTLVDPAAVDPNADFADSVHPSRQGYHKVAEAWLSVLAPLL